ncbi:MAG TPA: hypothetical protein VF820_05335, partial [Patescibacteria group bacterium]
MNRLDLHWGWYFMRKNVVMATKNKNRLWDCIFIALIIILDFYIILHFSYAATHLKLVGSIKDTFFKQLDFTQQHIVSKPLEMGLTDILVLKKFLFYQSRLMVVYIFIFLLVWSRKGLGRGEFAGIEHGSAEWGGKSELKKLSSDKNGIILGENIYVDVNTKN